MAIYFDGFDDKMLSFYSESGRVGMLAYPVADKYVKECDSKSPNFMGFVRNVQGNLVGVQLGGYVECKFTGIAPTPGYCGLIADGSGGVKVDEDFRRFYPYGGLASRVLGFTGGDNQGIIGLEVVYEEILQGDPGMILTITDAKGIEVDTAGERRVEPVPGMDLRISIDRNIQEYATQLAAQACATKEADSVYIVAMNPQNGEILAMVNYPEFDLNDPYTLPELTEVKEDGSIVAVDPATLTAEQKQEKLNAMWRNGCINDTYEPGSTFKIITAAAGLEAGVVTPESTFSCPGFIIVDDRKIRCHKIAGHGGQTFVQCMENSCNQRVWI